VAVEADDLLTSGSRETITADNVKQADSAIKLRFMSELPNFLNLEPYVAGGQPILAIN
jgi:hypothetical protein